MKILLICHDIPSMTVGATLPIYHLIKNLGKNYSIDLISFNSEKYDINELKPFLNKYDNIKIPTYHSIKDQLIYTTKNMLTLDNIHKRSFLNYYYHENMSKLIEKSVLDEKYDIIITDMPMAFYAKNIHIPKIVYAFDAVSDYNYKMYTKAESILSKVYWYMNYLKIHRYEKTYDNFDSCIVVNKKDKQLLEKYIKTNIEVIPNGVDTSFFKNDNEESSEKIVFLGDMSTPPNNDAVKYFINEIYPLICKEVNIPFYIVGRNPSEYIKQLDNHENIIVTGSVKDVRVYLTPGTIFITPMISGTGIKNKILEAMSMNLPVVSTSIGISGINSRNYEEFILADDNISFKNAIIELHENKKLKNKISSNARLFVKDNYSWQKSMKKLENIIERLIKE
ncbi:glycosyltransferase family 4 protein [Methanosphaera sp.]